MRGFDRNFHFVGMTFNPEMFVDIKGHVFPAQRAETPDTVAAGPHASISTDGQMHYSQPMPAIINTPVGGKALLRLVSLSVTEIADNVKLVGGEIIGFMILGHFSHAKVQPDRAERKNALAGVDGYASQLGFNAGNKFGGLEWVCHIIIGPGRLLPCDGLVKAAAAALNDKKGRACVVRRSGSRSLSLKWRRSENCARAVQGGHGLLDGFRGTRR